MARPDPTAKAQRTAMRPLSGGTCGYAMRRCSRNEGTAGGGHDEVAYWRRFADHRQKRCRDGLETAEAHGFCALR